MNALVVYDSIYGNTPPDTHAWPRHLAQPADGRRGNQVTAAAAV